MKNTGQYHITKISNKSSQ